MEAMAKTHRQGSAGFMTYPARGTLNRLLFKTPLILWRMGLGPLLGRWMLVLTTWGRKSGLPRHTMLEYGAIGKTRYLLAGWGERSDWYRNIQANSQVTVQVGSGTEYATARCVGDADEFAAVMRPVFEHGGDAYFRPMLEALDIRYDWDDLFAKRDRMLVVALDPSDDQGPPSMHSDLQWLWPVALTGIALMWFAAWVSSRR